MKKSLATKVLALALTGTMSFAPAFGVLADGDTADSAAEAVSAEDAAENDNAAYLAEYFDITVGEAPTVGEFAADLDVIAPSEEEDAGTDSAVDSGSSIAEEPADEAAALTWAAALPETIEAAGYTEFQLTYPEDKVASRLEKYGVTAPEDADQAAAIAAALDSRIIDETQAAAAASDEEVSKTDAESLLIAVVNANGEGRNYLGWVSDPDIAEKLEDTWDSFVLFDDEELSAIGNTLVENGVVTGYNLKDDAYDARFLSDKTITYSHTSIKHAKQLIGLLNSEDVDARVALEPKVSAYQYLLEWGGGVVPESTPVYEVTEAAEDLYITHAVEFDLKFEFTSQEDMDKFDNIILSYAKRTSSNADATGMIAGSWWQPDYTTTNTDMDPESYYEITDLNVVGDGFALRSFLLPEDAETVEAAAEEAIGDSDEVHMEPFNAYCNEAFYNYLSGSDYE